MSLAVFKAEKLLTDKITRFLGEEKTAALLCFTDAFDKILPDSVLWTNQNENGEITGVFACGNERILSFTNEIAVEIPFSAERIITDRKTADCILDKKYLMSIDATPSESAKGAPPDLFPLITELSGSKTPAEIRLCHHYKGLCEGVLIDESTPKACGYICFFEDFAVICDVFTLPEYRNRGLGSKLVKKLLNLSQGKRVYLLCGESRVSFYEKIGFKTALILYEYENKGA